MRIQLVTGLDCRHDAIATALARLGHSVVLVREPTEDESDLVVLANTMKIPCSVRAPVVWWNFDLLLDERNMPRPEAEPIINAADLILTKERTLIGQLRALGRNAYWLPEGCDPLEARMHLPHDCDCLFVGIARQQRRAAIDALLRARINVRVIGDGWGNHPAADRALRHVPHRLLPFVLLRAKIIIGMDARTDLAGYWSDRVYHTLACGAFYLTRSHISLCDHLTAQAFARWEDEDDLVQKARHFCDDRVARESIADAGWREVRQYHAWEHRCRTMLAYCRQAGLVTSDET